MAVRTGVIIRIERSNRAAVRVAGVGLRFVDFRDRRQVILIGDQPFIRDARVGDRPAMNDQVAVELGSDGRVKAWGTLPDL
jgi:hypothetical protein